MRSAGPGRPSDLPAGERERLAAGPDGDGALPHARQGRDRHMRVAVEPEVLVRLVGQHQQVVLDGDRATSASSSRVKTTPVGLCGELIRISRVRGVTAARSAPRSGRRSGPTSARPRDGRGPARCRPRRCRTTARRRAPRRPVVDQRQQRRLDDLRRPGPDHDLRADQREAVEPPLVRGDRLAQLGQPVRRRVLVAATLPDRLDRAHP